jgi:uncharacterized protein YcfJ
MKKIAIATSVLLVGTLSLAGCGQMNQTQEYTLGGAAIGAGAGALIGAGSGHAGTGALIGTAAGAVGGALLSPENNK